MPDRLYWDACVFLAYVKDEEGRASDVEAHLDDAEHDRVEIYTSALSIAEVVQGPAWSDAEKAFDTTVLDNIDQLFAPGSPVKVVEISTLVAQTARDLAREAKRRGFKLRPADSLHLATAVRLPGITAFHTYDDQAHRENNWANLSGLTVATPEHPRPPLDLGSSR